MNISPINFTGTIYFPNQNIGVNTDRISKFKEGISGRVEVYFSDDKMTTLPVHINDFLNAYKKAITGTDRFVEVKTDIKETAYKI